MNREIPLDGVWHFAPDPFDEGEVLGWSRPDHDASRWREVAVPTVFDRCGPGLAGYEGAGWFRKTARLPKEWEAGGVEFACHSANYRATVWVNGERVGENADPFLPFAFPLGTTARYGAENVITVRVDNARRAGEVPGRERGWRPYGGILRPVSLRAVSPLTIQNVRIEASAAGHLSVRADLTNTGPAVSDLAPVVRVEGLREPLTGPAVSVASGDTAEIALASDFPNAEPWSPENPRLYTAEIELAGGEVRARRVVRFGFRTVSVADGRVRLNGDPILLYGYNRHEDSPRADAAADPETARQDLLRMKETGANFVRLCHYPHDERTLDLCDEIGLLVMAEIPLYWWSGHKEGEAEHAAKAGAAARQLRTLVARDRHHPSVIAWSVSNETDENRPEVAEGNAALVRLAKSLDPTRLATHVSNGWGREVRFDADDLISLNGYPTWGAHQWNEPRQPHYAPSEGGKWWHENLNRVRECYPEKPILVTEFGYPALEGVRDGNISEEAQARAISEELGGILRCPTVSGATVWCWADHPWPEEDFINRITTSPFGVVTRGRESKAAREVVARAFRGQTHRPSLVLRRANLDDLPAVESLLAEGYAVRVRQEGDLPGLTDLMVRAYPEITWDESQVASALIEDVTVKTTFLITHGETLVATASARWQPDRYPDEGYVHWVASDPAHRGKNLGLVATLATLHEFKKWGAKGSVLHTDDFRVPAIKVYLKLGFVPVLDHATHAPRWAKLRPALEPGKPGGTSGTG